MNGTIICKAANMELNKLVSAEDMAHLNKLSPKDIAKEGTGSGKGGSSTDTFNKFGEGNSPSDERGLIVTEPMATTARGGPTDRGIEDDSDANNEELQRSLN
jgi:hypothetical protein